MMSCKAEMRNVLCIGLLTKRWA